MGDERQSKRPFAAEYAKSNRSKCKDCGDVISKDNLRLALMVQSPFFDGMQPNWYHFDCFWKVVKGSVKSTADIAHFDALRWDDQEKIRTCIESGAATKDKVTSTGTLEEFVVEYARSNRSSCHGGKCSQRKIDKDEVRVGVIYEGELDNGRPYGGTSWYHLECFLVPENFAEVEWKDSYSVEMIRGYKALKTKDRKTLTEKFPAKRKAQKSVDEPDSKKSKVVDEEKEKLKAQSNFIWKIRDELRQNVSQSSLKELLGANEQSIPTGESKILDRAADIMTFGPIKPCTECDNGQFALATGGYHCQGNMSAWTKCTVYTQDVQRKKLAIPKDLAEEEEYLASFKFKAYNGGKRIFPKEEGGAGPSNFSKNKPLLNLEIAIAGKVGKSVSATKKLITQLGGKYSDGVFLSTACVISKKDEVDKMSAKVKEAKKCGVHVVSFDVLNEIEKGGDVFELIPKHSIASWGTDVKSRTGVKHLESLKDEGSMPSSYEQIRRKSAKSAVSSKGVQKVQLKGGAAVDPESGYEDSTHVLKENGMLFSATLGMVDVTRGANSYYKLQLLESDIGKSYFIFRSWGRVGTHIGGNKVEPFQDNKADARRKFVEIYTEKTGNPFGTKNFEKIPHKFYPLDIDYGEDEELSKKLEESANVDSKLHPQIQNLMKLIFDIDTLKKTMVEFEIDMDKMPLGKLSRSQIQSAYSVLTELQTLIEAGNASRNAMLDATNRFFTLIPHNFGFGSIPLLDTLEVIQTKAKMLDSLLEIEVAYSLLKASRETQASQSPIDANYEKLKCGMKVVPKGSDEFKMIEVYTKNTHGATHSGYTLTVEEVFCLDREGESSRYKPFKKLHNRMLLWHGSRLSNFCGILSQGLRIAPPEAPATGYMFGKGVYFADMVSKSANYCFTNQVDSTGLMLLCEVAIGNMHELTSSSYITKLPSGKHSTKGIGQTYPDPDSQVTLDDGTIVPTGKAKTTHSLHSSLMYNEYIVYDVSQIRMKYLIKLKFNYKY